MSYLIKGVQKGREFLIVFLCTSAKEMDISLVNQKENVQSEMTVKGRKWRLGVFA